LQSIDNIFIFRIDLDNITNFICNLKDNEIYIIKRMNNNIKIFKEKLSTNHIDFISNTPTEIDIDKRGRAYYFRMFGLEINRISNFIYNIQDNDVILIIPFITISNTIKDPYICLSSQFLIGNKSDPILIYRFLTEQINTAFEQYQIDTKDLQYNLYFKHKKVELSYKEF
jgi:hypothetical protein